MSTEQEHWKLVDPSEAMEGDQWLDERGNWLQADEQGRSFYSQNGYQVRRRMTGAEIHGDALLAAIRAYFEAFDTGGDSEEGHALMAMHRVVCLAEGRQLDGVLQILDSVLTPK